MKAAEGSNQKGTTTHKAGNASHVQSSSAIVAKRGDLSKAVAGLLECGNFNVSGGLLASCCGSRWATHCVFRTSSKHLVAVVNSEQCKWCNRASSVQENVFDGFTTRAYLQGIFGVNAADTLRLSELIAELMRTQTTGKNHGVPFIATPPYCSVENVTHISGLALQKLIDFDREFGWGDHLVFNTKRSESSAHQSPSSCLPRR